jgi:peptide/nickel transport system substrate-binding protein
MTSPTRTAGAAAALLATTMLVPAAEAQTITAVMHSGLRVLDPVITTAHITRNHAYMIYDVLIAEDENFEPQPQMADWEESDDGLTYTFRLRDGLMFHDGEPVTAADVVASLRRWGERDSGGQLIFDVTEDLVAEDDDTVVWTLAEPFPPMIQTLAKQSALPPFIMPERVAESSADETITEYIGSGPFRFVEEEYNPGVSVTYEKFEDYVPRDEEPSWMAGGKVVHVDRVVWTTMPDAQTAISALNAGEIDYIEQVQVDLMPILEANPDVVVELRDPLGYQTMGRMNFKHPPFDNKEIRQAALMALSQEDILATMMGDPQYYEICGAIFGCGTPLADEMGGRHPRRRRRPRGRPRAARGGGLRRHADRADGADRRRHPDHPAGGRRPGAEECRLRGRHAADGLAVGRHPPRQHGRAAGGRLEHLLHQLDAARDRDAAHQPDGQRPRRRRLVRLAGGRGARGAPPRVHQGRERRGAGRGRSRIQEHVLDEVIYVPLGQYMLSQGRRTNITDMIESPVPVFWNVRKEE